MTQAEKVIELLNAGPLDFITAKKYGISQLKTRICLLRKNGVKISHTMQAGVMETGHQKKMNMNKNIYGFLLTSCLVGYIL